jgi:hypothetical protein
MNVKSGENAGFLTLLRRGSGTYPSSNRHAFRIAEKITVFIAVNNYFCLRKGILTHAHFLSGIDE